VEHGSRLILVHAVEGLPISDAELPSVMKEAEIAQVMTADAATSLERIAASAGAGSEIRIEPGKADQIIERIVREADADLLVIGPGKPQNLRERLFGSTVDRLVRSGVCPILVVKREADRSYCRVVAGIDFSPMSFAAVQVATRIAPQASFELVHTVEIPLTFEQAMLKAGTSQAEIKRFRASKVRTARKEMDALSNRLPVNGKVRIVHGDPAAALVRTAKLRKTDLVVVGIQGRGAVSKLVFGSVARKVLATSYCDVLLAKEPSMWIGRW